MMVFFEDGSWIKFSRLIEDEKLLVLVIYNKDIFSANDEKRNVWKKKGKLSLQLKRREKRIIYLNFLHLLEDCVFLTLCPITNFFKTKTGFLMKIKSHIITVLS